MDSDVREQPTASSKRRRGGAFMRRFERWSVARHVAVTVVALVVITGIDVAAPKALTFSIFYFVPVAWATWFVGRRASLAVAVCASLAWGGADFVGGITANAPMIAAWNEIMRLGLFLLVWAMIAEMRDIGETSRALALSDPLTGIANMRVLRGDIEREIERLRRYSRPFALAYLDLDKFKEVNDSLGHLAGDDVLRSVAAFLGRQARDADTVARLGGDEFAVLMPETDERAATAAAERLSRGLSEVVRDAAPSVEGVGATIGVSVFKRAPWSVDQALSLSDGLMYEGKRAGGGRVTLRVHDSER